MTTIYDMNPTDEELKLLFNNPRKSLEEYLEAVDEMVVAWDKVRLHLIRKEHDKAEELTETIEFVADYPAYSRLQQPERVSFPEPVYPKLLLENII